MKLWDEIKEVRKKAPASSKLWAIAFVTAIAIWLMFVAVGSDPGYASVDSTRQSLVLAMTVISFFFACFCYIKAFERYEDVNR